MIAAVDSVCFCQLVVFIIMETILKLNYTNKVGGCSTHVKMDVSYLLAAAVSLSVHRYMLYLYSLSWPAESLRQQPYRTSPQRPQISTG